MPHPLDSFFAPESIALIGASRDLEKIPGRLLSMLRKNEYPGKIYPINPNYADIDGLKCYKSIADVGAADRSRHHHHSGARGARRARAMRRRRRQERRDHLLRLCGGGRRQRRDAGRDRRRWPRRTGMRISGPNAEGFYQRGAARRGDLQPDRRRQAGRMCRWSRPQGGSPSSRRAAASALRSSIAPRRSALRSAIASAPAMNAISAPANSWITWCRMPSTDVILLFIEGIRDVDKFLAAARRAAEIGKPVIVTKVGRSGAGERAAASHTASMAGWSAAYDAVFAKYGFIVSNDLDEAVTIAAVLTTNPLPKGDRVAVLTVSGGAGIWGADTVSMQGLQVPELSRGDPGRDQAMDAVLRRGAQSDRCHRAGRQQRRPAEEHRSARTFRRGRRHPGGAVAVQRGADAVQAGRAEAGDRGAEQAGRVLFLHAAVAFRAHASLRNPASWCCRA